MTTKIIVKIKNVYGNELIYPVSHEAMLLCALTGQQTLSQSHLKIITGLDYEIEVETPKLKGAA